MLNIIYMGSSSMVIPPLERLLSNKESYNVVAVVTPEQKPYGRGKVLKDPDLAIYSKDKNILTLQPHRASDLDFIEKLKSLTPDVIVTASYGQILSQEFLDVAKISTINIHPSLLPMYRGATPVQTALFNGDKLTGVSILYTVKELDAGNIIVQKEFDIEDNDTTQTLMGRLFYESSDLLVEALEILEKHGKGFEGIKQDNSKVSVCKKIKKEDALINWNDGSENIINKYRAFYPWPGVYSFFNDKRVNIVSIKKIENKDIDISKDKDLYFDIKTRVNGEVFFYKKAKKLLVKTSDGCLEILRLKVEGSKEVGGIDFWNGIKNKEEKVLFKIE